MAGSEDRKTDLIVALAQARMRIDHSAGRLRETLDVPAQIRRSVSRNMFAWLGGAALIGVVVAKLPRRTKKVFVDREGKRINAASVAKGGILLAAAKLAFDAARPLLLKVALERFQPLVEQMFAHRRDGE